MKRKPKVSKVQELVYELRVSDAMSSDLVSVRADTPMRELREVLRSRRIAGTPVLRDGAMVGVVSIEDLIKWLAEGGEDCAIEDRMTPIVQTLFADEPLVHAASRLEETGLGRFPVVSREDGTLVGLITKGDIIETLLRKLEIEYHEEEIHRYRASHIFEDIVADRVTLNIESFIKGGDFDQAGRAASGLRRTMTRLGIHPDVVRRAAIATYEAEMNVIIYANVGRLQASVDWDHIQINVDDEGDGIPDVDKAMQPGYSTASDWVRELGFGAGMGLTNIQRCSDDMRIESTVGKGTHLSLKIDMARPMLHSTESTAHETA